MLMIFLPILKSCAPHNSPSLDRSVCCLWDSNRNFHALPLSTLPYSEPRICPVRRWNHARHDSVARLSSPVKRSYWCDEEELWEWSICCLISTNRSIATTDLKYFALTIWDCIILPVINARNLGISAPETMFDLVRCSIIHQTRPTGGSDTV
jgi:hypothetical protein